MFFRRLRKRSALGVGIVAVAGIGLTIVADAALAPDSTAATAQSASTDPEFAEADFEVVGLSALDRFGSAVDIDDDRLVIGAPGAAETADAGAADAGTVYVFERRGERVGEGEGGQWAPAGELRADDADSARGFGTSVSVSGDRVVVGSPLAEASSVDSGAVYVFEIDDTGRWTQSAVVAPGDGESGDQFGRSVALDGDDLVVGAALDGDHGRWSGSAYVYRRTEEGTWVESAKLAAADAAVDTFFGTAVGIDAGRVVVGAGGDADAGPWSGAAYVFEADADGAWGESAKLVAADGDENHLFGESVDVDGDLVVIGARSGGPHGFLSGAAYVFEAAAVGGWNEVAKLVPPDGAAGDGFGWSVATSRHRETDRVVVGALDHPTNGSFSGAAYLFEAVGSGDWSLVTKIAPSGGEAGDGFGSAVAIDGSRVVVGASEAHDTAGSTYLYESP